jgi:hypothetical protein
MIDKAFENMRALKHLENVVKIETAFTNLRAD